MSNLNVINNVFGRSNPSAVEETANHFRLAAFTDEKMAWQGVTIYQNKEGWVAQLDDGRRFMDASLLVVTETAAEESACWGDDYGWPYNNVE
jgi:hypothetical protein